MKIVNWCSYNKSALLVDDSTILTNDSKRKFQLGGYQRAFANIFLNEIKDGKTLYTDSVNAVKRRELRQCHYHKTNRYKGSYILTYDGSHCFFCLFVCFSNKKIHILNTNGQEILVFH